MWQAQRQLASWGLLEEGGLQNYADVTLLGHWCIKLHSQVDFTEKPQYWKSLHPPIKVRVL